MSHLFEIESAVVIKPCIFILASRGVDFQGFLVYFPVHFHWKEC